jgi:endonuclease-3 related protein
MTAGFTLKDAASALRRSYGPVPASPFDAAWPRTVAELALGAQWEAHREALRQAFLETPLQSPSRAAVATVGQLAEALAPFPRAANKAPVLHALAKWWLAAFGDELSPEWNRDLEANRRELRQIRGLGPETVDRLLLFGADRPVFPIDRGVLRVAVRHGWLDLPVDDEDAQGVFRSATGDDVALLQSLARWLQGVGASNCGRTPVCVGCPLEPLLPPGGPINPDGC